MKDCIGIDLQIRPSTIVKATFAFIAAKFVADVTFGVMRKLLKKKPEEASWRPRRGVSGSAHGKDLEALEEDALAHAREFFGNDVELILDKSYKAERVGNDVPSKRFSAIVTVFEGGKKESGQGEPGPARGRSQSPAAGSERQREKGGRPGGPEKTGS